MLHALFRPIILVKKQGNVPLGEMMIKDKRKVEGIWCSFSLVLEPLVGNSPSPKGTGQRADVATTVHLPEVSSGTILSSSTNRK